ncbi:MAG: hypothetical protein ACOC53_05215 [Candidatus Saliniplasma sp.]
MYEDMQDIRITEENVHDVICCPGGKEIKGKSLTGDLSKTLSWRREMINEGMTGFISYKVDEPFGFVEYIPAESAPFPVHAPDDVFLMCYHWATEDSHLEEERRLISLVIEDVMDRYGGISTFAWDHPIHFPQSLLKTLGFEIVEELEDGSLMWLPFDEDSQEPELIRTDYEPADLSQEGRLAIEQAYSHRCPYSIHNYYRIGELIREIDDDLITYEPHVIDTREDALKYAIDPMNWQWLYLNGLKTEHLFTPDEDLEKTIIDMLESLD